VGERLPDVQCCLETDSWRACQALQSDRSDHSSRDPAGNLRRAFDFKAWLELPASTVPTLFDGDATTPSWDPSTAAATAGHVAASYEEAALDGVGH
jgi:hypothetical protein